MDAAEAEGVASSRRAGASRALAVALAVFAGVANLSIAFHFEGLKGFDQLDLFFNADASARLHCMVDDRCGERSSFSHPNLALFVNPPVRVAGAAISLAGATGIEPERARRLAALCVSPLASAVKAPIVFYLLLGLGLTLSQAALLALLSAVSFSQLAFGSMPESFALTGALLAAGYLLALRCMQLRDRRLWPWVAIGVLVTGVTVSNLAAVAILFGAVGLAARERPWIVLGRTGSVVALVLLATIALTATFGAGYQLKGVDIAGGGEYVQRWMRLHRTVDRATAMPSALAHTFAAPEPGLGRNIPARFGGARYQYRFLTAHREQRFCFDHWLGAVFIALFALGGFGYRRAPPAARERSERKPRGSGPRERSERKPRGSGPRERSERKPRGSGPRWLCGASLAILAFNWGLHSVWGVDLILYSQHWQAALVVLLAGLYRAFPSSSALVTVALCALLVATGLENLRSGAAMTTAMQVEHRGSGEHSSLKDYR
jgi:hypothetical protein